MRKDDPSAEVVLNIENNGTIAAKHSGSYAVIDIYAGDSSVENTPPADVTINGSLELTVDARESKSGSDVRVINLLNNHDSLTINGDTEVNVIGLDNLSVNARASYDGIRVYSGSMNYNGDFALNGLTFNRADDSANDSYVTGIYSTTIGERILGFGVEVGDDENDPIAAEYSQINLGSSNEDTITVQEIKASAKDGWLSVVGVQSEGEDSVITIKGAAAIQNIEGSNDKGDTEVIAIQAASGGQVDVDGDLTIKNIKGTGVTNYVAALTAYDGGILNVNADGNKDVVVNITGDIDGSLDGSDLNIKLLNADSSITGASAGHVDMTLANGAVWNIEDRHLVKDAAYDANYKWSYVNTLSGGDGSNYGIVNLNIDASTVNSENNNRLFIEDTHSGTHYITLNNIDSSGNYNAAGTILVSVNKEQGEFKAKDSEGALYWNRYSLDRLDKSEGEAVTDGYNTDWVLAGVEHTDEPTTSVDTILGANALNYYTWIMESDKLMKRMGDLRHNKADENGGSWVRVRGSKISGDKGLNY